jgi:threonine synthase
LLNILVHYPLNQISDFQRKQLTTANSPNVKVATFEGGGDDMDAPIKRMLTGTLPSTKNDNGISNCIENDTNEIHLCGVNSYNIGRPLVQMVHFIWTYLQVVKNIHVEPGDKSKSHVHIILVILISII